MGLEHPSAGFQFGAQFPEVVDFAIIDDAARPFGVEHRLVARIQVNDGQAPMAQDGIAVAELRFGVRAAVGDGIEHSVHEGRAVCSLFDDSEYAAHII